MVDLTVRLIPHSKIEQQLDSALAFNPILAYYFLMQKVREKYPRTYSCLSAVGLTSLL